MSDIIMKCLALFSDMGYFGIMFGLMIEIIPSELVLGYGGYLISQGKMEFGGAVLAGTIGGTLAQLFLYWAGSYGGRPFLMKYGKYILINEHQLDAAERWFKRYGAGVVFIARFIPIVRHAISIPAGIAKMSPIRFIVYTVLAILPWTILFLWLGKTLGDQWHLVKETSAPYIGGLSLLIILAALYFWWNRNTQEPIVVVTRKEFFRNKQNK